MFLTPNNLKDTKYGLVHEDIIPIALPNRKWKKDLQFSRELTGDICTLGESPKYLHDDILCISQAIISEFFQMKYLQNALIGTFKALIYEQPHKQPAIALLLIQINHRNYKVSENILKCLLIEFQEQLDKTVKTETLCDPNSNPWNKVKLLLRFFSLLSPIFKVKEIISLYRTLLSLSCELNDLDPAQRVPMAEMIMVNTVLNIPFLFYFDKKNIVLLLEVQNLLNITEKLFINKGKNLKLCQHTFEEPCKSGQENNFTINNVKKLLSNDLDLIVKLFPDWSRTFDCSTLNRNTSIISLFLPSIEQLKPMRYLLENSGTIDSLWKHSRHNFHIFSYNKESTKPEIFSNNSPYIQLFQDLIIDNAQMLEYNRKEAARQMSILDLFFKADIFSNSGLDVTDTILITINETVVETILNLVFMLPEPTLHFAYYQSLLVEICRCSPKDIAPVFGKAFRFFYETLPVLDFESTLTLLDWFSNQLANFHFSWKWNEWESDYCNLQNQTHNPKLIFIKNLIKKELSLTSDKSEVNQSLPPIFQPCLNISYFGSVNNKIYYKSLLSDLPTSFEFCGEDELFFKKEIVSFSKQTETIIEFIHLPNKERSLEKLENIFKDIKVKYGQSIRNFEFFKIVLLTQCLCFCGRRSLSHSNKYIQEFGGDIFNIVNKIPMSKENKEMIIMESLVRYWNNNSQTAFIITESFKQQGLLSTDTVFKFIFRETDNQYKFLTDYTATQCILKNLNNEYLKEKPINDIFLLTYKSLCTVLVYTLTCLKTKDDELLNMPTKIGDTEYCNTLWVYFSSLKFIKCIMRKYSKSFRTLNKNLIEIHSEIKLTHKQTIQSLTEWVQESNYPPKDVM